VRNEGIEPLHNTARTKEMKMKNSARVNGSIEQYVVGVGNLRVVADWVREKLAAAHRGTFYEGDRLVIFDNGRAADPLGVRQLELALTWLRRQGYLVQGVGTCSECHTWVAVVQGDPEEDTSRIDDMLWKTWGKVLGFIKKSDYSRYKEVQYQTALATIADRPKMPRSVLNQLTRRNT
jgi:hypothetical protein